MMYEELVMRLRDKAALEQEYGGTGAAEDEAADAIEEMSKPRWISVEERLPEDDVRYVLCCGAKGGMFVGWVATRTYNGGDKATAFVSGGNGRRITHWMPLPEPPKEGET